MEVGERIQQRRKELGMTQDDLAIALGYKSRSSINKIEKGERGIPQKLILDIANVLMTTPGYILGSEDVPNEEEEDFRKMALIFGKMNSEQRRNLLSYAEWLAEKE